MEFAEIETITQGELEIMNPISEEKLLRAGKMAGLCPGKRSFARFFPLYHKKLYSLYCFHLLIQIFPFLPP